MQILPATGVRFAVDEPLAGPAVASSTAQFGALAQDVDFPDFVGGLIQGVFDASVTTSIQQMDAYEDLVQSTPSWTHPDRWLNPHRGDD
jgi:hypothetical protein